MSSVIGTGVFIDQNKDVGKSIDMAEEDEATITTCNKDTGQKKRVQRWTRGVWFCVGGGGHIQTWQPLYK